MSAVIIDLAQARVRRSTGIQAAPVLGTAAPLTASGALPPAAVNTSFLFWTGASGNRYVHTVYGLFDCPPVQDANYILAKRHATGERTVVSIGRAGHDAPSVNLAEIRLRSAQLGANEVHIHLLAGTPAQSERIESDLRGSLALA